MYKVLLVDDERIILEGISTMIDWRSCEAELVGTSRNGIEALDFINKHNPDIVISDIKMPGMDGLQLVKKASELNPNLAFILLSGFDDFGYARTAMQHGVKHYLLKPCNENTIINALTEVISDLQSRRKKDQFMHSIQAKLAKALPYAKEQFLKELVTNKTFGQRDWDDYRRLFHITEQPEQVQLILFQLEGSYDYEHLFAIKNIAEDVLGQSIVLLGTTIGSQVLLMLQVCYEPGWLFSRLELIKSTFTGFYKLDLTIAASDAAPIDAVRSMYHDTLECLNYRFYLGEGTIISKKDIADVMSERPTFYFDDEQLSIFIKSGDWSSAQQELSRFFTELSERRLDSAMSKSYALSLLVAITRLCSREQMSHYMQCIAKLDELSSLRSMEQYIMSVAEQITETNLQLQKTKHSSIIQRVINVVQANLSQSALSLNWVASEILYMNADYLGKLFKKETGEKFSNYVMRLRIEKALELIEASSDVKVFELAEQLGFGDNPQYFSQVFKKYTGQTPTEYRKTPG